MADRSIEFFDRQFQRQVLEGEHALNPFEALALPYLTGRVLDYGCGMGNLAMAAAAQGCSVLAFDASAAAITHLRERAAAQGVPVRAEIADLRAHDPVEKDFDAVVCIGLLMFFDDATATATLRQLQERVRPGGVAVVNLLVEGTTYMDMFEPASHCLWTPDELRAHFAGWDLLEWQASRFPAGQDQVKAFCTLIARKPVES